MRKNAFVGLRLEGSILKSIDKLAKDDKVPRSEIMRKAVEEFVNDYDSDRSADEYIFEIYNPKKKIVRWYGYNKVKKKRFSISEFEGMEDLYFERDSFLDAANQLTACIVKLAGRRKLPSEFARKRVKR